MLGYIGLRGSQSTLEGLCSIKILRQYHVLSSLSPSFHKPRPMVKKAVPGMPWMGTMVGRYGSVWRWLMKAGGGMVGGYRRW